MVLEVKVLLELPLNSIPMKLLLVIVLEVKVLLELPPNSIPMKLLLVIA